MHAKEIRGLKARPKMPTQTGCTIPPCQERPHPVSTGRRQEKSAPSKSNPIGPPAEEAVSPPASNTLPTPRKPTSQKRDVGHPLQRRHAKMWATRPTSQMVGITFP